MKVLFIAPYRDGTGYAHAAIDTILAMDAAGIDIIPRPIKLNNHNTTIPERIEELENKSSRGADFVIQHTLPSMMEFDGHFKANIAMYCSETSNFKASNWSSKLNCMDIAWVPSNQMIDAARQSGVTIPISKIPYPIDVSKFEKSYKPVKIQEKGDTFTFYTIAEMNKRKNLGALIRAFHTEFEPNEPVSLVIKTHHPRMSSAECKNCVVNDCQSIKEKLNIYPDSSFYKQEIIITDMLTDDSLYRLHSTCDCFVLPSHGEAWGIPAFDAMGFGKTPIVTNWGGFKEFVTDDTGWLVDCYEEQVFGIQSGGELYTGKETWAAVSIEHLRKCMRAAYVDSKLRKQKAELGIQKVYDFSYELVGSFIKKELESYEHKKWNRSAIP